MLTRNEFEVLYQAVVDEGCAQRRIAERAGLSVGTVNKQVALLQERDLMDASGRPTVRGRQALEPYRVRGAVILAAGACARFMPLSFEKPKAMFEVCGEVLIERLIRQLHEAEVRDVTVVVGYMKESFFNLEERFGVRLVMADDFATRNNSDSLWQARAFVGGSYVVSSDEYYADNPFRPWEHTSFCSVVRDVTERDKLMARVDARGRIHAIALGTGAGRILRGPSFLTVEDASTLVDALSSERERAECAGKLWEEVLHDHLAGLRVMAREASSQRVWEFDYVTDLAKLDRDFFVNVDSRILDNICATLSCRRAQIEGIEPIKAGLTNLSVLFSVQGQRYVYRHPGNGTDQIINRRAEARSLEVARDLGLDDSFVYEDPEEGWKISRFIEDCEEFDFTDDAQVDRAMALIRRLHESGEASSWSFDFHERGDHIQGLLAQRGYEFPAGFFELRERIDRLAAHLKADRIEPVLCHNDFYAPNLLVRGDSMWLIDWEYSAMGDHLCDLANYVAQGPECGVEEAVRVLERYLRRAPDPFERRHFIGAVGLVGWYWYVWAIYKGVMGNPVGEWLYLWYRAARLFTDEALADYEGNR
ncbi:phosphotransferase [Eggerthellaceae bacterium zg-1084]|uniref:Phosphotransferase n=1 Tax=Berryella wangjianweii TaxID=2734634 RepID=A0A6M8IYR9_9ACTN|nr:phosphotransferase [Berryella wangjianweii]NPD31309.1 phosphotransferase [Berryella wangjianweii]QKF06850.1 phosphotransferase [Berryella wangjianweii]